MFIWRGAAYVLATTLPCAVRLFRVSPVSLHEKDCPCLRLARLQHLRRQTE